MSVILLLMIFSLIVAGGFLAAFLWAVKTGQFDDKYTPSVRILFDDAAQAETMKDENLKDENLIDENLKDETRNNKSILKPGDQQKRQ